MLALLIIAVAAALLAVVALVQARLERAEDTRAGSLSLLRSLLLLATAILALLNTDASALSILPVVFGLLLLWAWQQLVGRKLATRRLAEKLGQALDPLVSIWARLVADLRLTEAVAPEEFEQELYDSVEEFTETVVREVMVPRVDLEVIDAEDNLENALSLFISTGHSRMPIIGKSIDDVVGILYLKDVARIAHQDPARLTQMQTAELGRQPLFTPESKPVVDLLRQMQLSSVQIAVVSDEYGGVAGLVTMEDLIEELIGEISDEYDREPEDIEQLADGSFRVNPRMSIEDLAEHFDIELVEDEVETIGGLLTKHLGELPKGGEVVALEQITLTAERVEPKNQRLVSIILRRNG